MSTLVLAVKHGVLRPEIPRPHDRFRLDHHYSPSHKEVSGATNHGDVGPDDVESTFVLVRVEDRAKRKVGVRHVLHLVREYIPWAHATGGEVGWWSLVVIGLLNTITFLKSKEMSHRRPHDVGQGGVQEIIAIKQYVAAVQHEALAGLRFFQWASGWLEQIGRP